MTKWESFRQRRGQIVDTYLKMKKKQLIVKTYQKIIMDYRVMRQVRQNIERNKQSVINLFQKAIVVKRFRKAFTRVLKRKGTFNESNILQLRYSFISTFQITRDLQIQRARKIIHSMLIDSICLSEQKQLGLFMMKAVSVQLHKFLTRMCLQISARNTKIEVLIIYWDKILIEIKDKLR